MTASDVASGLAEQGERLQQELTEATAKLRNIRLVVEQLARTADDTDPRRNPRVPLDAEDGAIDVATANATRSCVAAVNGALNGDAQQRPPIPEQREGDGHDHSTGWDT